MGYSQNSHDKLQFMFVIDRSLIERKRVTTEYLMSEFMGDDQSHCYFSSYSWSLGIETQVEFTVRYESPVFHGSTLWR